MLIIIIHAIESVISVNYCFYTLDSNLMNELLSYTATRKQFIDGVNCHKFALRYHDAQINHLPNFLCCAVYIL